MKKLFVSILALAAFAACQSDFNNDVNLDAPQGGSVVNQGAHTIYAEVGVGEADTKATYGDGLKATWEENDQIALLQENANYGSTFSVVNKLNIKEGWGKSSALFNGEISVDATSPRVYHIAYPASAVKFNVSMSQTPVVTSENYSQTTPGIGKYSATGYATCTYNSTMTITLPTSQNGKWEPYMYASTSEAVNSEGIGAKTLNTLTGAIAIRAFEADGVTPKQLKSITITSSDVAIAGAFSGTSTSVGNTATITGGYGSTGSTVLNDDKLREEARANLTSALQGYEATSTSVTKAMSLAFNGSERVITLTGLENIPMDSEGYYTYYVNIAPTTVGTLEIQALDINGGEIDRVVNDQTFTASHRKGYKLTWEEASLIPGTIETWYDNWNTSSFQLEGNTIYARNIGVQGVPEGQVLALGVEIDGQLHAPSAQVGVLSQQELKIEGVSNGTYSICTYAKIMLNGKETVLKGDVKTITVTPIPTATYNVYTSYSKNGGKSLRNDVYGNELRARVDLSDVYIQTNFVKSATFTYGGSTANLTPGSEWKTTLAYGAHSTSIKVVLKNGYTLTSDNYTSHITGIPFTMTVSSNADGWEMSGSHSWNSNYLRLGNWSSGAAYAKRSFHMPADTSVRVKASGSVPSATVSTTFSISVSGSSIYSAKKGDDINCNTTTTMKSNNTEVKLNNSYSAGNSHSRVSSLEITYNL